MKAISHLTQMIFECKCSNFEIDYSSDSSWPSKSQLLSSVWGDGLILDRQHAITWTNDDNVP